MNQSCRVCGEAAAGFHFGAFTCEGCKSFFGRTYNNRSSIGECKNNNSCVINKKNRTSCKACRLKKCFFAGMSKQGSRYGRRSNWFKIHCLLQDQQQQQHHQQQHQQQQQTSLPGQERPLDLQQAHLAHNQQIRADSTSLSSALGQLELQQHHQQLPSPPVGSSPLELAGSRQQQPSSTTSSSSSSSSSSAAATAPAASTLADPSVLTLYAGYLLQEQQLAQQRAAQHQAQQQQLGNLSQLAHPQNLGKGAEVTNDVGVPAPQPGVDMNALMSLLLAFQAYQQQR